MSYEKQLRLLFRRLEAFLEEQREASDGYRRRQAEELLGALQRLEKPMRPAAFWMPGQHMVRSTDGASLELVPAGEQWRWRVVREGAAAGAREAREAAERAAGIID